jgi:hypothetical protein
LLDNVGGDGIHLEMDFKNEDEVEKALRIVEEYQTHEVERKLDECIHIGNKATLEKQTKPRYRQIRAEIKDQKPMTKELTIKSKAHSQSLQEILNQRILILDGAMGTMAQQYGVNGCCDELAVSKPEIVQDIHRKYLTAGADIITTDTFSAQRI